MNTPDMEWEKGWKFKLQEMVAEYQHGRLALSCDVLEFVVSLLTSRDTYWKDRVRKTVGKIEESARTQDTSYEYGEGTYEGMMHSIFILKDITNEDNLR